MKYPHRGRGFTLPELLVTLALVAILTTLVPRGIQKLGARGKEARCASHLRQIGLATTHFATDHRNEIPFYYYQPSEGAAGSGAVPGTWFYNLAPYLSVPRTEVDDPAKFNPLREPSWDE